MKNITLSSLLFLLLLFGLHSCNNGFEDNSAEKVEYISEAQKDELITQMIDSTVYNIGEEKDFNEICKKISVLREQELRDNGYIKIHPDENLSITRASIQSYSITINPNACPQIENSVFKAKFSSNFCSQINTANAVYTISPSKTYICLWRDAGTYYNLASNQHGGVVSSPNAALIPSKKSGYVERGYDAYVNSHNQYILSSQQLEIYCEDVSGTTTLLDIRYPLWNSQVGYIINFKVLTL